MSVSIILAALCAILPAREEKIVECVCREYGLNAEKAALLRAIRRAENGPRLYYGVVDSRCVGYVAQCRWAANTIRLRYTGDVAAFAARWCPCNADVWTRNVKWFMKKQGYCK